MPSSPPDPAREPLLPPPATSSTSGPSASPRRTSLLGARRVPPTPERRLSSKAKGKQRAAPLPSSTSDTHDVNIEIDLEKGVGLGLGPPAEIASASASASASSSAPPARPPPEERGRCVSIIFSGGAGEGEGNLEVWVEPGESVGSVKEQIRHLRPALAPLSLRLIHSGRLLTDGILLVPWLRSLEERVARSSKSVGAELEGVLKEVGQVLGEGDDDPPHHPAGEAALPKVFLHCNVGPRMDEKAPEASAQEDEAPEQTRRRGFDVLLDAGLSVEDVASMRRQFYENRGEEVPEGLDDASGLNDEHARALEEQWIEGDLTVETATTSEEGTFTSILQGLLSGFLFPWLPWYFFRELPLPNFFDADAEALADLHSRSEAKSHVAPAVHSSPDSLAPPTPSSSLARTPGAGAAGAGTRREREELDRISERVANSPQVGGENPTSVVYGDRMQMGIVMGTLLNLLFAAMRLLN